MAGPAGTGKSVACLNKLLLACLLKPGISCLIARKTQTSLASAAMVSWRKIVAVEAIEAGACWYYGGSRDQPPQWQFHNGSVIATTGLDKPTKIMSTEFDLIYVQEATELDESDWEFLLSRLRNWKLNFQQLIADCNPDSEYHWLYQRCIEGKTKMLKSEHRDNPELIDDDGKETRRGKQYLDILRKLSGVRRKRLLDGLWVGAEGMIYEEVWRPEVHVIDSFIPPNTWPRHLVIDFGFKNPFVCQWWAIDEDGRGYLYREIYWTQRIVRDHCKLIRKLSVGEPTPSKVVCDHDAEGRAQLEQYLGLSTTAAIKAVVPGIDETMGQLRLDATGRPQLYLMRDAVVEEDPRLRAAHKPTCTIMEIPGYIWLPPAPGRRAKEEPRKEDDHGCDALRYFAASRALAFDRSEILQPVGRRPGRH